MSGAFTQALQQTLILIPSFPSCRPAKEQLPGGRDGPKDGLAHPSGPFIPAQPEFAQAVEGHREETGNRYVVLRRACQELMSGIHKPLQVRALLDIYPNRWTVSPDVAGDQDPILLVALDTYPSGFVLLTVRLTA